MGLSQILGQGKRRAGLKALLQEAKRVPVALSSDAEGVLADLQSRLREITPRARVDVSAPYSSLTHKRYAKVTFLRLGQGEKPPGGILENAPGFRLEIEADQWPKDGEPEGKVVVQMLRVTGMKERWVTDPPKLRKYTARKRGIEGLKQAADYIVRWFGKNKVKLSIPTIGPAHLHALVRLYLASGTGGEDLWRAHDGVPSELLRDLRLTGLWWLQSVSQGHITDKGLEALVSAGMLQRIDGRWALTDQARQLAAAAQTQASDLGESGEPEPLGVVLQEVEEIESAVQAERTQRTKRSQERGAPQAVAVASPAEISARTAQTAFMGTSFSPKRRAQSARAGYAEELNRLYADLLPLATTPDRKRVLDEEFAELKRRYRSAYTAWLGAEGRTTSWMITGRSGRNVSRERKRLETADRRRQDAAAVLEKGKRRILRKLKGVRLQQRGGVLGDLQKRVAGRRARQKHMKAANKIVRSKPKLSKAQRQLAPPDRAKLINARKIKRLVDELGMTVTAASKLLEPDFAGRLGYPSYTLTNNNKEIRRLESRIREEQAKAQRAAKAAQIPQQQLVYSFEGSDEYPYAGAIEYDYGENRIRLSFSERIPRDVFRRIRSTTGFNWSRAHQAFSAIMGHAAVMAARQISGRTDLPYPDQLGAS